MTRKEIELLNNQVITEEQLDEIMECEGVTTENCGCSSQYPGATWYDVQFEDGSNIDVFVKF